MTNAPQDPALSEQDDERFDSLAAVGAPPGSVIDGTYLIERVLGVGGMGVVALAMDQRLRRHVAIKFVNPATFAAPAMHELFIAEARLMARLAHRNVLAIYACGDHGPSPYFVMEYVDGPTAARWLADRPAGTLPSADEVVAVLEQACMGVEAIHASGTVHRDLKPSNLLVDARFRVAVGDFGLSRPATLEGQSPLLVGTAAYLAPEAAFGEPTTREYARDIYALGCIAYELFVGRPPFLGETAMTVLTKHIIESPELPSERRPGLAKIYDDVILKALAKDPTDRYASVADLRAALLDAHRGTADPKRILVAEDDPEWSTLLVAALKARFPRAEITAVVDGITALDSFCDRSFCVVLADLEMPEMNGTKLVGALRGMAGASRTPIIVLTAAGAPGEWKRLAAIGADAFLVKPVDPEDLELVIRRTLRTRRLAATA